MGPHTTRWWTAIASLRHHIDALPFVAQVSDGTISHSAFEWYLVQDVFYMRELALALNMAASLAPSQSEAQFWARNAADTAHIETDLIDNWLPKDAVEAVTVAPAVAAYIAHLAGTAERDYAVLTAAVLPCYWIYGDVAARKFATVDHDHRLSDWLSAYADPAFDLDVRQAISIVEAQATIASPAQLSAMDDAFVTTAHHELAFFSCVLDQGL